MKCTSICLLFWKPIHYMKCFMIVFYLSGKFLDSKKYCQQVLCTCLYYACNIYSLLFPSQQMPYCYFGKLSISIWIAAMWPKGILTLPLSPEYPCRSDRIRNKNSSRLISTMHLAWTLMHYPRLVREKHKTFCPMFKGRRYFSLSF